MITIRRTPDLCSFILIEDSETTLDPYVLNFINQWCSFYKRDYDVFKRKIKLTRIPMAHFLGDNRVLIPAGYFLSLLDYLNRNARPYTIHCTVPPLKPDIEAAKKKISFRPYQEQCLEAIAYALERDGNIGGLVVAPPAFGKTYLIGAICAAFPEARVFVVSRRRDVILNCFDYLSKIVDSVGIVTTGKHLRNRRVMLYTIESLWGEDTSPELMILDEIHELVTDRYFSLLMEFCCPKIGLTATPDTRFDNLHKRIEALVGRCIFEVTYEDAVDANLVVPIVVQWLDPPVKSGVTYESIRDRSAAIWSNDERNKYIADVAREFYKEGQQVLILVTTIEHAFGLHKYLPEFEVCYSGSSREGYTDKYPRMSSKKRDELRERFSKGDLKAVIATGVWAVGVSFNDLQVLVRADAQSSATYSVQAPGRVCRVSDRAQKPSGLVIDFMDTFSSKLYRAAKARSRTYEKQKWIQLDPSGRIIKHLK